MTKKAGDEGKDGQHQESGRPARALQQQIDQRQAGKQADTGARISDCHGSDRAAANLVGDQREDKIGAERLGADAGEDAEAEVEKRQAVGGGGQRESQREAGGKAGHDQPAVEAGEQHADQRGRERMSQCEQRETR